MIKRVCVGTLVVALLVGVLWAVAPARSGIVLAEEAPWVQNPANGHFYRLMEESLVWSDAEARAVEWGGHLVTITDADEEAWLKEMFYPADLRAGFWIGFNDIAVEGAWVWTSGEMPGYENWCPGEPNDVNGEDVSSLEGYPFDNPEYLCWNDNSAEAYRWGIVEVSPVDVTIDIKPGSNRNAINLGSRGVLRVAVLSTDEFDASTIDPTTVDFAGAAALRWSIEDVDGDGIQDLLFTFKMQELDLNELSTEATLTGLTFGDLPVSGTDTVHVVP